MTDYFETPLQDDAAALRAVAYVHGYLAYQIKTCVPNAVSLQVSGDVDVLDAATGDITDTRSVATPSVDTGAGGTTEAPPAVAALMQLRTGTFIAGRRVRGRTFVSPLSGSAVTSDGVLANTEHDALVAGAVACLAGLDAGDLWVVWHRPKEGAGGSVAPITSVTVPYMLAVLRSRRD
jgi:hypothetical protein